MGNRWKKYGNVFHVETVRKLSWTDICIHLLEQLRIRCVSIVILTPILFWGSRIPLFFFNCTLRVSQAALLPPKTMRQSDGTVCRFCLAFCPHSAHHTPISLASSDIWSLDAHLTIWSLLLPLLHYLILSQSQDVLWDNAIFSQAHCVS